MSVVKHKLTNHEIEVESKGSTFLVVKCQQAKRRSLQQRVNVF